MRLVDTSAWIEWLLRSQTGLRRAPHIPDRREWLVPTMVQLELAKWLTREKGEDLADQVLAFSQTCRVSPLDTDTAILAAASCRSHSLATADSVIYATARIARADLLTCDAQFEKLAGVIYVSKVMAGRGRPTPAEER